MSTSLIFTIALPIVLGMIMFGIGLSLTVDDFIQIKREPVSLAKSVAIHLLTAPLFALLVIKIFDLPYELGMGLMLLAGSPSGPVANIFTHLSKGDVALTIALVTINTALCALYLPVIIYGTGLLYLRSGVNVPIPFAKVTMMIILMMIPMLGGMLVKKKSDLFARMADPWIRRISGAFLVIVATAGFINEIGSLYKSGVTLLFAIVVYNAGIIALSAQAARRSGLSRRQSIASIFDVCVPNCVLPMAIAVSPELLNNITMAIPAIFYSIYMFFPATLLSRRFLRSSTLAP
jgi:BASS family bile acid:Na+ symporter